MMTTKGMIIRRALERTGDHDLYFNWFLYQPDHPAGGLRSCDYDALTWLYPALICSRCAQPLILLESARSGTKYSRYTVALAEKVGCPAYVVNHNGRLHKLDGTDRDPSQFFILLDPENSDNDKEFSGECPEQEFCDWLDDLFKQHRKLPCSQFRKIKPV